MNRDNCFPLTWAWLMDQKDEVRTWTDWALRAILFSMFGLAVSYLKTMSQDIGQMSLAVVELKSENRRLADRLDLEAKGAQARIEQIARRVDRLEGVTFFRKQPASR